MQLMTSKLHHRYTSTFSDEAFIQQAVNRQLLHYSLTPGGQFRPIIHRQNKFNNTEFVCSWNTKTARLNVRRKWAPGGCAPQTRIALVPLIGVSRDLASGSDFMQRGKRHTDIFCQQFQISWRENIIGRGARKRETKRHFAAPASRAPRPPEDHAAVPTACHTRCRLKVST